MKYGLIRDLSNEEYHGTQGVYSSSQIKDIVKDGIRGFHRKHILGEKPKMNERNLRIGNYFHTAILEPHLLEQEYVIYKGVRSGDKFIDFFDKNKDKTIINDSEYAEAKAIIDATEESHVAMDLVNSGEPELSCFTCFYVERDGSIYNRQKTHVFTEYGWQNQTGCSEDAVKIDLKSRADTIILDDIEYGDAVADLKSTSGPIDDDIDLCKAIEHWSYELSAAMYLAIFSAELGREITDWYWIFASKTAKKCRTVKASSTLLEIGRLQFIDAIRKLANAIRCDFEDTIDEIGPSKHLYAKWRIKK